MSDPFDNLDKAEQWIISAEHDLADVATPTLETTNLALEIARLRLQLWHAQQQREYRRAVEASRAAAPVGPPPMLPYPAF